jgi:iron(III) transport system substrate-binding protein
LNRILWLLPILALPCCGPSREVVVVYSPHGPDVLGDYERRFETAYPAIDVQLLDMGSQDVYARVRAEQGRPQGDVWWGGPAHMFMQAAGEGLLATYRPPWADAVEPAFKDADDLWYGTYKTPLAIAFNNRHHTKDTAPQTWDALLEPKWQGKITIRKPHASGTMRTFIGAMILRAGSEDAGLGWLAKLDDATESYTENPQLLFDHMKRRENLVSVWIMPDIALQRERNGFPLDCIVPPETPVITEGIALLKGAPNRAGAELFYEFVTTPESLAHQAEAYSKIPARTDINPATLPKWIADQTVDAMPIDWPEFARNEEGWMARWDKEVYSRK